MSEPGRKLRILYLVTEDWYFVSHRLGLARAARDAGFEVVVVTRTQDHAEAIRQEGFRLVSFLLPRARLSLVSEMKSIVNLARVYRQERPDIVHHVALKPCLYGSIAALMAHGPRHVVNALTGLGFVFTRGTWKQYLLRPFVSLGGRFLFNRPGTRLIFQNEDDLETLRRAGIVVDENVVLIRGSGVDLASFPALPEPEEPPTVTMVSRMLWNKGVGELVEATRLLKQRGVRLRTVLVGMPDPENPSSISERQLCEWHDDGLIQWWGYRDDVVNVWRQSHIAVLPSYREGLPKSLLEAAACGRPIIASDVPGCREIARPGDNGLLVPAQDAGALADAIERLLADHDLRNRMGQASRRMVVDHFHQDLVVRRTLDLYADMLDQPAFG